MQIILLYSYNLIPLLMNDVLSLFKYQKLLQNKKLNNIINSIMFKAKIPKCL